jgi:hypothetical protein
MDPGLDRTNRCEIMYWGQHLRTGQH